MLRIKATITTHDGLRVRLTLDNSTKKRALYHVNEVYPNHQSVQLTVVRQARKEATC
ncbi:hypothetical protein [Aquabacterium sp.]|uniref:hypothetical protein n=1 Tax=Aquabacterium sp. TaxID=1872578 RepID=UPI0025C24608|nr:hypothetical protein [Aquabacterium sp.]